MFVKFEKHDHFNSTERMSVRSTNEDDPTSFARIVLEKKTALARAESIARSVGQDGKGKERTVTTAALGEEGGSKDRTVTTAAVGEEGGSKDHVVTTKAIGEEGGKNNTATTYASGEEGGGKEPPKTSPPAGKDDCSISHRHDECWKQYTFTTQVFTEEGGKEHTFTTQIVSEEGGRCDGAATEEGGKDGSVTALELQNAFAMHFLAAAVQSPAASLLEDDDEKEKENDLSFSTMILGEEGGSMLA